eukprot:gene4585-20852_t
MLFSIYHLDSNTKYRYALDDIAASLKSEDFQIPQTSKKGMVARQANDICLDSEGVYKPCNDDDYESLVSADRLVTVDPEYPDWEEAKEEHKDDRKNRFREKKKEYLDGSSSLFYESNVNKEYAIRQFSGSRSKKNISRKVQNAEKRFVSDQRMLFSEVYEQVDSQEDVDLLVIVSSGAKKRARRDSIRGTWWTECSQNAKVRCLFFTDDINSPKLQDARKELLHEKEKYDDMVFQPIDIGLKFGYRMLYQMQWAVAHYRFKYLLRVDDDVIVCLHHLLHDLQDLRTTNLQWGFMHCVSDNLIYMDEGLTMFSFDLVLKFLSQDPLKMRCHVYGDQQIAIWINDLNLDPEEIYVHDPRIHHNPPAAQMLAYFNELEDICAKHIIIHGVYPDFIDDLWMKRRSRKYKKYKPEIFSESCDKPADFFWYELGDRFRHQPQYCYKRPAWDVSIMEWQDGTFAGREVDPDFSL